jgi:putative endonuclease
MGATLAQGRGRAAEDAALAHLCEAGLVPVARNVGSKLGEVDLILRDGAELVFVEVRSRAGSAFGGAAASIGAAKQMRVRRAAQQYLLRTYGQRAWPACRFDVVAIEAGTLQWIRGAF